MTQRVAIIGLGIMGRRMLGALRGHAGFEAVALYDPSEASIARTRAEWAEAPIAPSAMVRAPPAMATTAMIVWSFICGYSSYSSSALIAAPASVQKRNRTRSLLRQNRSKLSGLAPIALMIGMLADVVSKIEK